MTLGTPLCDSCGRAGEVLCEVRRVYVTGPDPNGAESAKVVAEAEWWCAVCRDHYPHVTAPT